MDGRKVVEVKPLDTNVNFYRHFMGPLSSRRRLKSDELMIAKNGSFKANDHQHSCGSKSRIYELGF